ncbi:hypothetical protein Lsai_1821 [Legionella sainthelensi]|uniref:Isoprenylcysteine carboxylmethyltransferase family protein n=1 Tax=Legionella sainthelensi TaxID=28087 RepID=A0A0W0YIU7_9GAMM|nr:isoprenylcysteine carboxylmethyltransferase family protein [Legionella sainthelensi]KTD56844.1 hypothetical protein Lsai_1821 [Legionella sainthelensi]VEH37051.1 Putative protein-S-isoprenylcysteine methyltransferase [Legionella sainthelensi]
MNQLSIIHHPYIYLVFISFHLFSGQGLTGVCYWLRFGKSPIICYQKKSHNQHHLISQWLILPVLVWFSCISLYALSQDFRSSCFNWPLSIINPLYGWGIAITGLVGMLVCQYEMGEAFRVGQESKKEQSQNILKTKGCFKFSRNPIYFFSILYLIGVSLWSLIWPVWIALMTIMVLIHFLVLEEEHFLAQRFGDAYLIYKKSAPRYIGLIRT